MTGIALSYAAVKTVRKTFLIKIRIGLVQCSAIRTDKSYWYAYLGTGGAARRKLNCLT